MFGYFILRTTLQNPFFRDLFDLLTKFGIPIEGLHTETGPGVLEAAIRYAPALEAADRAVLFKTAVKEIAYRHGYMATFMAKINETCRAAAATCTKACGAAARPMPSTMARTSTA